MKLNYKILLGFAALIAVMMLIEGYTIVFLNTTSRTMTELVEKKFAIEKNLQQADDVVMQIHSDIWDAMLFGEDLRRIRAGELEEKAKAFYTHMRTLRDHLPEKNDALNHLSNVFRLYFQFGTGILEFKDLDEFKHRTDVVMKFKENKTDLIKRLHEIVSGSSLEYEQSLFNLKQDFQTRNALVVGLTGGMALLAGFMSILIANTLTRPIERLTAAMKVVETGDFSAQAEVRSRDEFGALADAFNTMGRKLGEMARRNAVLYESLEEKVRQRTAELSAARDAALEAQHGAEAAQRASETAKEAADLANHAKSEFLANMSHELRTPLNGILGYAQVLKRHRSAAEYADVRNGLDIIEHSGAHLLNLISEVLDLSKIEARKLELRETDLHLPEFLQSLTDTIRIQARQKGLDFHFEPAADLPHAVRADEQHLRQVLLNLLGNAVKFTDKGHVALKVRQMSIEHCRKEIQAEQSSIITLQFSIHDTGPGIPPEQLDDIFEAFHQHRHAGARREGVGLGLAISRELVALMGGELHVQSVVKQGSAFWFELALPEIEAERRDGADSLPIGGYRGEIRRILIVDDDATNRGLLRDMLEPLGFRVKEAENGKEAVQYVNDDGTDLILMDLMMPEMDGFEAIRRIRQTSDWQTIPAFAVSANVFADARQRCLEAGFTGFLSKPVQFDTLLATFGEALQLEWVYETAGAEAAGTADLPEEITPMVAPPQTVLQELYTLLRLGDVAAFRQNAEALPAQHAAYQPFVSAVNHLATTFQLDALETLLEEHMDEGTRRLSSSSAVDVTHSIRAELVEASGSMPFDKLRASGDTFEPTVAPPSSSGRRGRRDMSTVEADIAAFVQRAGEQPPILVVDDTPVNIQGLCELLAHRGMRLLAANNGESALEIAERGRPDVILLDVYLPGIDGFEVCRRLKAQESTADIPVIFLTVLSETEDRLAGFKAGGVDYITKPFRQEEVLARISTQLYARQLQRQVENEKLRFQALSDASFEGLLIHENGRILDVNATLEYVIGLSRQELLGTQTLDLLTPECREDVAQHLQTGPLDPYEAEAHHKNGSTFPVELQARPIRWRNRPAQLVAVRDISWRHILEEENRTLHATLDARDRFGKLVGNSVAMHRVYDRLVSVAASDAPVILYGETGTGKEMAARTIAMLSKRHAAVFFAVNCSSIVPMLFESQLFGYRKGAFTGATQDTPGYFDKAVGGILFLDEVGELPLDMQAKLLRVLNDGTFTPVGSTETRKADARIIAATNRELRTLVREGKMREDFFHRLHVLAVEMPPLRQRKDDIPLLVSHFLEQSAADEEPHFIPSAVLKRFMAYDWPGNVRELFNEVQRYLAIGEVELGGQIVASVKRPSAAPAAEAQLLPFLKQELLLDDAVEAFEHFYVTRILKLCQGKKAKAAERLGIGRKTLYRKLKKYEEK